ncbi:ABC transporter permease [Roseomonas sp. HJA6]|uniref:ABC transporter permease n=1 Tax=Roseomonas alba TaxID=2846776 RepID=A0ABS7AH08_9PROT|nr:ABC transporter permease [Neoroseomonas alba]MBW6401607.1 ABC transporter permease [Neoroseomonas alba]
MTAARLWRWAAWVLTAVIAVYLVAPMAIVVIISFSDSALLTFPPPGLSLRWYRSLADTPAWRDAILVSLEIMVITAAIATALGTAAAIGLASWRGPLAVAVRSLLMAPLVVPHIISGAAIFLLFDSWGWVGSMHALVFGHTALALPYVVATVGAALETYDRRLDQAALTLGASPRVAFLRITLPLISPGILAGLLFAAMLSFDELIVSLFLSTPQLRTVTVLMWSNVFGDINPEISAIATVILLVSMTLLALQWVLSRRRGPSVMPGLGR